MLKIVAFSVLFLGILGIILFIHSVYTAKEIDPKEPFLWDDYNPNKDPNASRYTKGY